MGIALFIMKPCVCMLRISERKKQLIFYLLLRHSQTEEEKKTFSSHIFLLFYMNPLFFPSKNKKKSRN